jgi:cell division protein FtsW
LALFSYACFSASSNLAYIGQTGNTLGYLVKHIVHICIGFIIFMVHKVPYHYFKAISKGALYIVWILLAYTLIKGTVIAGANASRWIQVPFIGVTFQTSTLAAMVLFIFVARYLSKTRTVPIFKSSIWELWLPVFITLLFILPANFSTTALIFQCFDVGFHWKYPLRYIGIVVGSGIVFSRFLLPKRFQMLFPIV